LLRRQVMDAVPSIPDRSAAAFAIVLVSAGLPFLYGLAACMVITAQVPVATSMVVRLLGTALGASMLLVLLQGRATALTMGVALFSIIDQARTIYTAMHPGT